MEKSISDTIKQRNAVYGGIENVSVITQRLQEVIRKSPRYSALTDVHKTTIDMMLHKTARAVCGDIWHVDNYHDIIGYMTLLENFVKEKNREELKKSQQK